MMRHEDDRRLLIDFERKSETTKVLFVKMDSTVGQHYHKVKTEMFFLTAGEAVLTLEDSRDGRREYSEPMTLGDMFTVLPFHAHRFDLKEGSVLVCMVSHPYDSTDDYEYEIEL